MVKRRRTGTRGWTRGLFAIFWIVLAGASGLYLFTLFNDPAALGGQVAQFSAVTADGMATGTAPAAPQAPVAAATSSASAEVTELKGTIEALSQQVAALDARLKPIEKFIGPVAALPPSASVTTSPPKPPAPAQAASEPAPAPAAAAEDVTVEEDVVEAEPTPPAPQPAPRPEPKPEASAPVAAAAPEPEATPEPEAAEPPAVAVAPMEDDQGEPQSSAASTPPEKPASNKEVDIAAYDPVELPPAANDGSTRYGIEIGTVGKRDELRPLWREFLTKHAALVAGLQPRCVLAPDKKWRLVAGPFSNAQDAEGACTLFKKADRPCSATVFAGDAL